MKYMLDVYTVSFFGHRDVYYSKLLESRLEDIIFKLIKEHEFVAFLTGYDGEFDRIATSAVKRAKRNYAQHRCDITWIMPYEKADYTKNQKYYDEFFDYIEVCAESAAKHPKAAIQARNRHIVDRSDYVVFWIEKEYGGAYQTMKYAKENEKAMINLAVETAENC
ncbi:MAG: hypothetical protein IJ062_05305 [Firmicutes bacterium]|nr:hypothetical protein [Bacillota bacterium]